MTQRRYELSDFEWSIIEPLLPNKPRGVVRSDDCKVLNGIYWRLLLAAAHRLALGRDSERYGPSTTCYNPTTVRPLGLDSSSDPRPAAWCERQKEGGPKKWRPSLGTSLEPLLHGASRGGLTTKIHALVDANGLPILLKLTPAKLMTGEAPTTCSPVSAKAKSSSPTAATTATH
jgi:transposase